MVLVISAVPLAFEWCQIACAGVASSVTTHSCHHHHAGSDSSGRPIVAIAGIPHACGHDDDLAALMTSVVAMAPPGVVAHRLTVPAPSTSIGASSFAAPRLLRRTELLTTLRV
jgi:hypothetical protein